MGLGTGDQYMVAVVAESPLGGPSLSSVAQSLENLLSLFVGAPFLALKPMQS